MKKFFILLLSLLLICTSLFAANSVKYVTTLYPSYNLTFSNTEVFQFSPQTFGMGLNSSTYFLDGRNNGFGITTKFDFGIDFGDTEKSSVIMLMGAAYQRTINRNLMFSVGFGPSFGVFLNEKEAKSDSAFNFGFGLDAQLFIHPDPTFGFTIGVTGYVLPMGYYIESIKTRPTIYSISAYCGFVFAFGSKSEDSYYIPSYYYL